MDIKRLVVKAARLGDRNPVIDFPEYEPPMKFVGFGKLSIARNSESQLAIARDQFVQAVTPDKTLVYGSSGYGVDGLMGGILTDVLEAAPGAFSSLVHVGAAAVKGAGMMISGWDVDG